VAGLLLRGRKFDSEQVYVILGNNDQGFGSLVQTNSMCLFIPDPEKILVVREYPCFCIEAVVMFIYPSTRYELGVKSVLCVSHLEVSCRAHQQHSGRNKFK